MFLSRKPTVIPPHIQAIHDQRRKNFRSEMVKAARLLRETKRSYRWRNLRWTVAILINAIFFCSYQFNWQVLSGSFTSSLFFGIPLADPFATLEVWLTTGGVSEQLLMGVGIVLLTYWLVGGRTFCSWVCPYGILAEWGERLNGYLHKRGMTRNQLFKSAVKYWFFALFIVLTLLTGYPVFESISPMSIVNRALTYGAGLALVPVVLLLVVEIFLVRRAWCRYICPIGVIYALVGRFSPVGVSYNLHSCHHDGACRQGCPENAALNITKVGAAPSMKNLVGADCTNCGLCVDICPTRSLRYTVRVPRALTGLFSKALAESGPVMESDSSRQGVQSSGLKY